MIDEEAKMDLTFKDYTRDIDFIPSLIEKAIKMIKGLHINTCKPFGII